ncbi:MAG: RagB/SusD family nutrient uptake outer membrane protein [Prevotella sp.]|nr:RagB/SusD family nutrient uptake outer membrane protein [Prevotella sp.]MBQ9186426.1 RagB/SusD family nutrient uptake outer membrane protein [Prevotella sp.]
MKSSIKYICLGMFSAVALTACSDQFLQDKKNFEKFTAEIYDNYDGAKLRVNSIYGLCLPDPNSGAGWNNNCTGNDDDQSKSTEEYASFSLFVDPEKELSASTGTMVPDYFQYQQKFLVNAWGRIRSINECIQGLENSSLSREQKDELEGQCYFFRAWCYYNFVKWYGGVPIIRDVQDTSADSYTPRSSAKACFDFMLDDLNTAAAMLKEATGNGGWGSEDWGRVTTATALALKGRVLLLWASPLFNRSNDKTRWTTAYETMKEDLSSIDACGHGLFQESNNINASSFGRLFGDRKNIEDVFVTLFNVNDMDTDAGINNQWERKIRPANTGGQGLEPSAYFVDMFPMADGKLPSTVTTYSKLKKSDIDYDRNVPFYSRDPRFYRTFAFPGVRWAYNGDASQGGQNHNPSDGANYALWNYRWYVDLNDQGNPESGSSYGADNLLGNAKGMYVRKRTDDADLGNESQYTYMSTAEKGGFTYSAAPYIEIRYAEVLLNLAEAACGANQIDDALIYLNMVRQRAGVPDYTTADFLGEAQAACMSAILLERQIELAYEGKRFDDMRRWMLFDGGANFGEVADAPATWRLSGWGGNTCTWLGFTPFNGQRRERMEFRTADKYGVGTDKWDGDPILNNSVERCAPLDLRKDLTDQQEVLKTWYTENLVRKDNRGDGYNSITHDDLYIHFYAKYYFLGLSLGAQNRNDARLEQTIGWENNNTAGMGTFDPLAE